MTTSFQAPAIDAERDANAPRHPQSLVFRLVNAWMPESILHGSSEGLRRAHIVVGFMLMLLVVSIEVVVFFNWALPQDAVTTIEIALVLGLGLVLMVPSVLRRTGSVSLVANMVIGSSYLVIVSIISVLGGVEGASSSLVRADAHARSPHGRPALGLGLDRD